MYSVYSLQDQASRGNPCSDPIREKSFSEGRGCLWHWRKKEEDELLRSVGERQEKKGSVPGATSKLGKEEVFSQHIIPQAPNPESHQLNTSLPSSQSFLREIPCPRRQRLRSGGREGKRISILPPTLVRPLNTSP